MLWPAVGLLILGTACGAAIRLMVFVVVLLAAAVIAIVAAWDQGFGAALLDVVIALASLQIGYGIGLVLRARIGARHHRGAARRAHGEGVGAPLGGKPR